MSHPFDRWRLRGFGPDLVPIIPPLVALTPGTKIKPEARGKAVGIKSPGGWHGLGDWHGRASTPADHAAWAGMGAGVGLQCGRYVALDLDVLHPLAADTLRRLAAAMLPGGVPRIGRAPKVVLLYVAAAGEHFTKQRIEFRLQGDDTVHAIEVLGEGQQFVVEGIHPGTGLPYVWPEGEPLAIDLAPITAAALRAFLDAAVDAIGELGGAVTARSTGARTGDREDVAQGSLAAPSEDLLAEALAVISNTGDRDGWIRMGHAIKAAGGTLDQWAEWSERHQPEDPEDLRTRWEGFHPPFAVGWPQIERAARARGWHKGVEHDFASHGVDFAALAAAAPPPVIAEPVTLQDAMFARYVWVEAVERIGDTIEKTLLSRTQFNARLAEIGPPHDSRRCAWAQFLEATHGVVRCRRVTDVTYRPGGHPIVDEAGKGPCFNSWRDSEVRPRAGNPALWLLLAERLFPDAAVRDTVLDWLASLVQRPGVKPAFVLVIGGHEGIGKDSLLAPIVRILGQHNVQNITMSTVMGANTHWLANCQLVIITEMHSFSRREVMERLKPIGAAPPDTLEVNIKFVPQYRVPNVVAGVYFTNHPDALALSDSDRRHFIAWSPHENPEAMEPEAKAALERWFVKQFYPALEAGLAEEVMAFLLARDISGFAELARAPHTEAKDMMRREGRSEATASIEDALESMALPDLVTPEDLAARVNTLAGRGAKPVTGHAVARALRAMGAVQVSRSSVFVPATALVIGVKRVRLWAMRDAARYATLPDAALGRLFAEMWAATKQDIETTFAPKTAES